MHSLRAIILSTTKVKLHYYWGKYFWDSNPSLDLRMHVSPFVLFSPLGPFTFLYVYRC